MTLKTKLYSIAALLVTLALVTFLWWSGPSKTLFRQVSFEQLPGWGSSEVKQSLKTFQTSCRSFVRQDPERVVGTDAIDLKAKDWQPACRAALAIHPITEKAAKDFFQTWFAPVEFYDKKPVNGLFTGYYLPLLKGSYTQSDAFNVPLYELPKNMVTVDLGLFIPELKNNKLVGRVEGNKLLPYYTREQINKGAITNNAKVLVWVNNPIDRLFLEIQGSGIVELEDGKRIYVGYDGQNGAPYTAIAAVLMKKGVMTKESASMQAIKKYLQDHPQEMEAVINQNKSFIFFRKLALNAAMGSQGVALTPGYSLAVDRQWIPLGVPLWLSTTRPDAKNPKLSKPMQRLMIAQDTGGAIRGKVRGDVFWGGGNEATLIAGHMKNEGRYWLLLPRQVLPRLGVESP